MIEATTTTKIDVTPKQLAELFSEMDSEQQAEFYNELGAIAQNWRGSGLCQQMCHVRMAKNLTATGRATMAKIGEWGREP